MEIVWKPSFSGSCMHVANAVRRGLPLADPRWNQLAPEVTRLVAAAEPMHERPFWRLATGLAGEHSSNRALAERLVAKLGAPSNRVAPLEHAIAELETAVLQIEPQLEAELAPRLGPIKQQWESRGPGFLRALERPLEGLVAERAIVYLVHPVLGGGGTAHLWQNAVSLEGVLYDPTSIPEAVRLGWLLSQLQFDLPMISEQISAEELSGLVKWASLPAACHAAADVQWLSEPIAKVLIAWGLSSEQDAAGSARVLEQWWTATRAQTWPERLSALRKTFLDV